VPKSVAKVDSEISFATTEELFCPQCGYNLHGLASEKCPECGLVLDFVTIRESRIPWTHRHRLGWFRAYWRTLILGTFSAPKLADELARPVNYRDAQLFRFITIAIGWAPLAIATFIASQWLGQQAMFMWRGFGIQSFAPGNPALQMDTLWPLAAGAAFPGAVPLALAIFLIMLSGVPSYFFHRRSMSTRRQNRAVAVSYYASAPIAFMPVALVLGLVAVLYGNSDLANGGSGFYLAAVLVLIACAYPVALVGLYWVNMLRLYHRATESSRERTTLMVIASPILVLLCVVLTLLVITWACGLVVLFFQSLG
jgi:hypothetical protein